MSQKPHPATVSNHPVTPRHPTRSRWVPDLGALVPDFHAETTRGSLTFRPWAAGHWVYLFAFPSTFASVCSTELVALAAHRAALEKLGVRLIGITPAGLKETQDWVLDLEKVFGLDVYFPIVADHDSRILRHLGLVADGMPELNCRPSLFVDPENTVRMHFTYPARLGRSTAEVLRCFEALQDVDYSGLAVPADWTPGDYLVAPKGIKAEDMQRAFGEDWSKISDYLLIAHV